MVSIITPNYNGEKFLEKYFKSLEKNTDNIKEIIIIDNASTDKSIDIINKYSKNLNINLIKNNKNIGFAKATNQGIKKAKSNLIFLLNNDTEIEENTICLLKETIEKNEKIFSVMTKMIQSKNRNLIDDTGDEYTILAHTIKTGANKPVNKYNIEKEIFSTCAGAGLYRKNLIEEIGLFDENFFAYLEDLDLSYRAQIQGYKNIYNPEAIVYHVGSGSSGSKYNKFKIKISARNNIYLIYKNFPSIQKITNFIFILIGILIKYLYFRKKGYGKIYLEGIKEGIKTRKKITKTKFNRNNWENYFKIEWKLIKNTFKLIKG